MVITSRLQLTSTYAKITLDDDRGTLCPPKTLRIWCQFLCFDFVSLGLCSIHCFLHFFGVILNLWVTTLFILNILLWIQRPSNINFLRLCLISWDVAVALISHCVNTFTIWSGSAKSIMYSLLTPYAK